MELALADYSVQDTVESVRATLRPLAAEKGLEFVAAVPDGHPARVRRRRPHHAVPDEPRRQLAQVHQGREGRDLGRAANGDLLRLPRRGHRDRHSAGQDRAASSPSSSRPTPPSRASTAAPASGFRITKKFVEMHGGRIWVESELGQGLDVHLRDPAARWPEAERHERQDHPLRRGQRAEPQDRARPAASARPTS